MKAQAEIVSNVLKELTKAVEPGIMTIELDAIARELIQKAGAEPYNLNYKPEWAPSPFPAALVTSVNNCICHGIPTEYQLKSGDIVNLDLGIKYQGLCGDAATTVPVGDLENKNWRLMRFALKTLYEGIRSIKAGVNVIEIGRTMQTYALQRGYVTNKRFYGHAISKEMHEKPYVPSYWELDDEWVKAFTWNLKAGDVVCLEPMLTFKDDQGYRYPGDGWSHLTRDGKYSAMFEHMILVKEDGYEVLTDHINETMLDN